MNVVAKRALMAITVGVGTTALMFGGVEFLCFLGDWLGPDAVLFLVISVVLSTITFSIATTEKIGEK